MGLKVLKRKPLTGGERLKKQYESMAYVLKRKTACAAMRNTLLPRLISGQLRLPKAASFEVAMP